MIRRPTLDARPTLMPALPHQSYFPVLAVGGPNGDEYQSATTDMAADGTTEGSFLTENMVGAYAQRCDRLMRLMQAGMACPALIKPEATLAAYEEGLRNEAWLIYWSKQRRLVG